MSAQHLDSSSAPQTELDLADGASAQALASVGCKAGVAILEHGMQSLTKLTITFLCNKAVVILGVNENKMKKCAQVKHCIEIFIAGFSPIVDTNWKHSTYLLIDQWIN